MRSLKLNQLLIIYFVLWSSTAQANIKLEINIQKFPSAITDLLNKKDVVLNENITLELGKIFFSVEKNHKKTIYDFKKKRIYKLNMLTRLYSDQSMFPVVMKRRLEFENAVKLATTDKNNNALEAVLTQMEHRFSIRNRERNKKALFLLSSNGKNNIVLNDRKIFLEFSKDSLESSQASLVWFPVFLKYYCGVHPSILKILKKKKEIPKKLNIYYSSFNDMTTLTILSLRTNPLESFSLKDFSIVEGGKFEFSPLINGIQRLNSEFFNQNSNNLLKVSKEALKNEHFLEAMLGFLEYQFESGKKFHSSIEGKEERGLIEVALNEEVVIKLMSALRPPIDSKDAEKKLLNLRKLQEVANTHRHILLFVEASILRFQKKMEFSKILFLKLLERNPYLTEAWIELGYLYLEKKQFRNAWKCWDIAHKISPDHKRLMVIDRIKALLLWNQQGFFYP